MAKDKEDDVPVDEDVWTRRINAFWNGAYRFAQLLIPILTPIIAAATLYYSAQNSTKIDQAKASVEKKVDLNTDKVKDVAEEAATHAAKAAKATEAVKVDLDQSRQERKEQFDTLTKKQDADLKNWHAYHTKEPEDMNKAQAALNKAIGPQ